MKNGKCRGCLLFCHTEQTLYEWADMLNKALQGTEGERYG